MEMEHGTSASRGFSAEIPLAISVSGVLLLLWSILEPVGLLATSTPDVFRLRYVIGYVTIVPSCIALMWGGRWLSESDIPRAYNYTVAGSVVAGGGGFLVFNVFLMLFFPAETVWIVMNWVRWAVSLGMCVGLVVGISYTRGLAETIAAERHSLRAEHLRKQRELVDHMNSILRHEVLNSAQIIKGNGQLLVDSDEAIDPDDDRLDRIRRQGDELTDVIQEVRALLHVVDGDRRFDPVDLAAILRNEVETVRTNHPDATIDTAVPAEVYVEGDELLGRVFGNLIRNAVEHNDPASVRVLVEVETADEAAIVTVRDDGQGIPEGELDELFDRPQTGTHGLGLYIVENLVDHYRGTIDLVETGGEGTTVRVTLPRAETPARAPSE